METRSFTCSDCGSDFVVEYKGRRRSVCDECKRAKNIARSRSHYVPTDKNRVCTKCSVAYQARQGKYCPDCRREVAKTQRARWMSLPEVREQRKRVHKERQYSRKSTLSKYGLTIEEFDKSLAKQGGVCAICSQAHVRMCVDHCHETRAIRGILCSPCNRAIGQLGDSAEKVQRAVDYLKRSQGR
jgi:hypothetical protein